MLRGRTFAVLALGLIVALSACKKGPTQEELFEKAKKAQEESNFPAAIDAYQEIVKLYPEVSASASVPVHGRLPLCQPFEK